PALCRALHSFPTRRSSDLVLAGQLQRHLNFSLNRVLDTVFEQVSASRGYYKARALRAQVPRPLSGTTPPRMPRKNTVSVAGQRRSEEHTSELQSRFELVCR